MRALGSERGNALITAVLVVAMMAGLGLAMVSVIEAQTQQMGVQQASESASSLAEAALNAEVAILGRKWPKVPADTPTGGSASCRGQTMTGTLGPPGGSTLPDQVQSILTQTYDGSTTTSGAKWWLNVCDDDNIGNAWAGTLLDRPAYDATPPSDPTQPRKLWVRAEANVGGRRRAVVGLVQAGGQRSVFPELGLVTGALGDNLGPEFRDISNKTLLSSLTGLLINKQPPMIDGNVGLMTRPNVPGCDPMKDSEVSACLLPGILKNTSAKVGAIGTRPQIRTLVDFRQDSTISADQLSLLRWQAQQTGVYAATVSDGALCPSGDENKIVFIEQVGSNGTGSCIVNSSGNPKAKALIVGAGGVRVCANVFFGSCVAGLGRGTFTGIIYALHRKDPALADVRIQDGAKVVGGVFVDNAPDGNRGTVEIVPPPPVTDDPNNSNDNDDYSVTEVELVCPWSAFLCDTAVSGLISDITPQLTPYFPAIKYDAATVSAITTSGDAAIVPGTFRQVAPMYP
jgi:type II secretory pathway pseudopilin PulG